MNQVNKTNIHDKGQYFTSNPILKQCVCDFVLNNPERVLEPSVGRGDLVDSIQNTFGVLQFDMYEIDPKIELLPSIVPNSVVYDSFAGISKLAIAMMSFQFFSLNSNSNRFPSSRTISGYLKPRAASKLVLSCRPNVGIQASPTNSFQAATSFRSTAGLFC